MGLGAYAPCSAGVVGWRLERYAVVFVVLLDWRKCVQIGENVVAEAAGALAVLRWRWRQRGRVEGAAGARERLNLADMVQRGELGAV